MVLPIAIAGLVAILINLPFGIWRARCSRFSWQWFAALHMSIPLVIFVRIAAGLGWTAAPLTVAGAMLGQVVGARIARSPS